MELQFKTLFARDLNVHRINESQTEMLPVTLMWQRR